MKQLKVESALTWEVGILRFGGTHCTRIASLLKNKQITFEFQLSMKFLKYFHKHVLNSQIVSRKYVWTKKKKKMRNINCACADIPKLFLNRKINIFVLL